MKNMDIINEIIAFLPIIIPLALIQLGLMVVALIHAITHPKYKTGNMVIWILVILLVSIIGPVLYFIIGKGEAAEDENE